MRLATAFLILLCTPAPSCAASRPPATTVTIEPPPHVGWPTPAERLLALLTADNPGLERAAMSLATVGDRTDLRDAGLRLVGLARAVATSAHALEGAHGASAEDRETEALRPILAAMSHVGGPAVVEYAFEIAEDERAPWDRRRLALRVLDRGLDPRDTAARERQAQAAARVPPPRAPWRGDVPATVARLRPSLRRCYAQALARDPDLSARVRILVERGPGNATRVELQGDALPVEMNRCIRDAVKALMMVDDEQGARVTFPVVFAPH